MTTPDLKIRQVAELLQLHPQSVLRLIHDGQLEAYRVGRRALRVPSEALERFLEERGRQSIAPDAASSMVDAVPLRTSDARSSRANR